MDRSESGKILFFRIKLDDLFSVTTLRNINISLTSYQIAFMLLELDVVSSILANNSIEVFRLFNSEGESHDLRIGRRLEVIVETIFQEITNFSRISNNKLEC